MQLIRDIYGLAGCSLVVLVILTSIFRMTRLPSVTRFIVAAIELTLIFVPFGNTSLAYLVRGVIGDVAVPTMILLGIGLASNLNGNTQPGRPPSKIKSSIPRLGGGTLLGFYSLIVLVAAVFYPMTMGFSMLDPYSWGYTSRSMLLACVVLSIAFEYLRQRLAATMILSGVLAFSLGVMPSTNLWDYLLDPLLTVISLVGILVYAVKKLIGNRHGLPSQQPAKEAASGQGV